MLDSDDKRSFGVVNMVDGVNNELIFVSTNSPRHAVAGWPNQTGSLEAVPLLSLDAFDAREEMLVSLASLWKH